MTGRDRMGEDTLDTKGGGASPPVAQVLASCKRYASELVEGAESS